MLLGYELSTRYSFERPPRYLIQDNCNETNNTRKVARVTMG